MQIAIVICFFLRVGSWAQDWESKLASGFDLDIVTAYSFSRDPGLLMKKNKMTLHNSCFGFAYLSILVVISHWVLPANHLTEVMPFFTWRLFANISKDPAQDLRIHLPSKTILLTEDTETVGLFAKHRIWYTLQSQSISPSLGRKVRSHLIDLPVQKLEVCLIGTDLPSYILSKRKQDYLDCHAL